MIVEITPKRLELLHEAMPKAGVMILLVNPEDRALAQGQSREVLSAARRLGLELHVLNASSERDFDAVFADLNRVSAAGLVIGAGSAFLLNIEQLAALTLRHRVPAISVWRNFAVAGGLMSYGPIFGESYAWRAFTPVGFSRANGLQICRCSRQVSSSYSSTKRLQNRSASRSRSRSSGAPTR